MKKFFYVTCYSFEPRYGLCKGPVRFRNLSDAVKFALKDFRERGVITSDNGTLTISKSYGGSKVMREGAEYLRIHNDGWIEYIHVAAERIISMIGGVPNERH